MGKIANAKAHSYNGISFRSKIEARIYQELIEANIGEVMYEVDKIILQESFKPTKPFYKGKILKQDSSTIRAITYTPDFLVVTKNKAKMFIEVKGFKTEKYNIKVKLFRQWLEKQQNTIAFEVCSLSEARQAIEIIRETYA